MSILEQIKDYLLSQGVNYPVYFNWATEQAGANECLVLWQYDGTPNPLARNAKVQLTIKNKDMKEAEKMADFIFDILYPIGQFQKAIDINGQAMHIRPLQEPFYNEKDQNNRHCYVFNINIEYDRRN